MSGAFLRVFGRAPAVEASAPGRVNLIGDHTDYAEGFCLPMPLALGTSVALAPAATFQAHSEEMGATLSFDPFGPPRGDWTDYIAGALSELARTGFDVPPVEVSVRSSVPSGAGLSSSAALEVATLRAMLALTGQALSDGVVARLAQAGENNYCGVQCGILDQMASAAGRPSQALLLDCRTGTGRLVAVPREFRFAIVHCGEPRRLAGGAYNARRAARGDGGSRAPARSAGVARRGRRFSGSACRRRIAEARAPCRYRKRTGALRSSGAGSRRPSALRHVDE
ncbi:MAG: galactokinase family protein [Parvibaculum sp.]|uniref:galactokinase n=1 Tax=Parvibaculum sp. TaxID=2024848 RepID=UPI0032EFFE68